MRSLARGAANSTSRSAADGGAKVSAVAISFGYDSEAAFSRAFKRIAGVPPAAWRRSQA
jgi:AraC-like DNA-binding protein